MKLFLAEALTMLSQFDSESIDSLITDPPAGISFMGKDWDSSKDFIANMTEIYKECLRVLKPGAHGLVWAIPRTSHWTATALEQAGFEIRDVVTHVFGTGFPKSLDVSKAIDKMKGAEREIIGTKDIGPDIRNGNYENANGRMIADITAPATPEAKQWQGFGTALKPASEHWILARKPLGESTVAKNVLKHGTGGLNIDASRIGRASNDRFEYGLNGDEPSLKSQTGSLSGLNRKEYEVNPQGRFPSNLVLSHNEDCELVCTDSCAVKELDEQSLAGGIHGAGKARPKQKHIGDFGVSQHGERERLADNRFGDTGGASRFFYCSKASKKDRNAGLEGTPDKKLARSCSAQAGNEHEGSGFNKIQMVKNNHPTVKSTKLMEYLIRLITPPNGTVLDPFMGSGSTGVAAKNLGFEFIGIEREIEYFEIAKARIDALLETRNS